MKIKVNLIILLILILISSSMSHAVEINNFSDIKSTDWFNEYISLLINLGGVSGYPDGSFLGNKTLTRAEASTVIVRILDKNLRQVPELYSKINFEDEVLRLVNIERKKAGLSSLVTSKELESVAKLKSEDMAINNYFSHTSPNYGSPFEMMNKLGIEYQTAGENIAKGHTTPEDVVNGWMDSLGHRANILNPQFNKLGVGIYFGQNTYWTQIFTN